MTTAEIAAPEKIQGVLDLASQLNMQVEFRPDERGYSYSTIHAWSITNGKPYDHDALWIYWTPGKRGGRVRYVRYCPNAKRKTSRVVGTDRVGARSWLRILAG